MKRQITNLLLICSVFLTISVQASTTIDTTFQPSAGVASSWGKNSVGAATFGEVFTVPTGNPVLNSFSMYLWAANGTSYFLGYIMQWNGSGATGSVLYRSDQQIFNTTVTDTNGMQNTGFAFNTGGLILNPGQTYVAFLSTLERFPNGVAEMPLSAPLVSGTGGWVYNGVANSLAELSSTTWAQRNNYDVWFKAEFTPTAQPVPVPTTAWLLGSGLISFVGIARKSKAA